MNFVRNHDMEMLEFERLGSCSGISHFITMRNGAKGRDPYSSFNLCDYTGDRLEHVNECRIQMATALDIEPKQFVFPHQVHGTAIGVVEHPDFQGDYDALITRTPGICIGVSTADCVPLLLYCPTQRVAAAVHAGWRGTVQRIGSKTVAQMCSRFGCRPEDILAGIGPSISLDAFEVGAEVVEAFQKAGFTDIYQSRYPANPHLNLWEANRQDLMQCGILPSHIEVAGICTYLHADQFFSARKEGIHSGRITTGIMLWK